MPEHPAPAAPALDDPARLEALRRTDLLDSPAEEAFDRYTRLLTRVVGAPVALLSLVDDTRQFFKSAVGLGEPWASARGTGLSRSFCQHVVTSGDVLRVTDARRDPRVSDNAAVDDLGVAAYLGSPVRGPDGQVIGSLCVIDHEPRAWTDDDLSLLVELAGVTGDLVAMRTAALSRRTSALALSHRLRSGLTALRLEVEQAVQGLAPGEARAAVQRVADGLSERSSELERALLALEQDEVEPVPAVDVAQVVDEVARVASTDELPVVVVAADGPAQRPSAPVARDALLRVLLELVELVGQHGRGRVTLCASADGGAVRVRVEAAGEGLPPEVAQTLTARSDSSGSTDGSAAEAAVRRLGARLLVRSGPSTSVELLLPQHRPNG